jgi:hypothetical protein
MVLVVYTRKQQKKVFGELPANEINGNNSPLTLHPRSFLYTRSLALHLLTVARA